jgi:hypothetical protein
MVFLSRDALYGANFPENAVRAVRDLGDARDCRIWQVSVACPVGGRSAWRLKDAFDSACVVRPSPIAIPLPACNVCRRLRWLEVRVRDCHAVGRVSLESALANGLDLLALRLTKLQDG